MKPFEFISHFPQAWTATDILILSGPKDRRRGQFTDQFSANPPHSPPKKKSPIVKRKLVREFHHGVVELQMTYSIHTTRNVYLRHIRQSSSLQNVLHPVSHNDALLRCRDRGDLDCQTQIILKLVLLFFFNCLFKPRTSYALELQRQLMVDYSVDARDGGKTTSTFYPVMLGAYFYYFFLFF